ncbi:MAG: L,D-transpeptidase family protein [Anaerolineae bacterium]|nr:L,D-transpeptidase family protein [Phycisphaerae bacterium]
MGRTGRRVSRGLIALLIVVVAIGGIFYLHDTSKTKATETRPPAVASATSSSGGDFGSPAPSVQTNSTPAPVIPISQTPSFNTPATQPTNAPTTQPGLSSSAGSSSDLFSRAMAAKDSGDLIGARRMLNDALLANQLSESEITKAHSMMAEINDTVVFSPKRFADDPYGGTYSVQSGDLLKKIAEKNDVTWELLGRVNNLSDPKKLRAGATIKMAKGPFHAVVNKRAFTIDIYVGAAPGEKGSMYVTTYQVGLGKDDSTPTGIWLVEMHKKIKNPTYFSPRGEGVIDADDPKNPLGEFWIGLTGIDGHAVGKASYGIHGTIEPNSIGRQESMGCIRMRNEDVARVFELLVEGKSQVVVRE